MPPKQRATPDARLPSWYYPTPAAQRGYFSSNAFSKSLAKSLAQPSQASSSSPATAPKRKAHDSNDAPSITKQFTKTAKKAKHTHLEDSIPQPEIKWTRVTEAAYHNNTNPDNPDKQSNASKTGTAGKGEGKCVVSDESFRVSESSTWGQVDPIGITNGEIPLTPEEARRMKEWRWVWRSGEEGEGDRGGESPGGSRC